MTPTEKVHEIAKRVYVLLLSVDESQRKCFVDQASQICEMAEDYGLALQSCIEKLKTDRTCPAPEGLEKEDQDRIFYKADDVGLSLVHYLPEPINPLPWVIPYILKLREPTGDEIFMSDCFTLAAIHDRVFREPGARLSYEQKLILEQCPSERFKRDKFASCVYRYYSGSYLNSPMLDSRADSDRRMAAIEKLFGRVQQKLTDKPTGSGAENGQKGETKRITKEEANVCARQRLMKTPSWDWTCRKLAKQIPCCLGWIPSLPAWRAYHEKRKELRRNKTIDTVSLSRELEAVLGEGEKDEVLNQLIAEQEGEKREDARQARLYLNHQKKSKRSSQ